MSRGLRIATLCALVALTGARSAWAVGPESTQPTSDDSDSTTPRERNAEVESPAPTEASSEVDPGAPAPDASAPPIAVAEPDAAPPIEEEHPRGPKAYPRTLRRWTEELKLYDVFETKLLMRAVFKSRPFRTMWSYEIARRHQLPSEDYAQLRAREADDAARFHELLVAVWADDSLGGDFEGQDAAWSLRLVAEDGRTVAPLVLSRIKRPNTQILTMFPFITPHDRVFVVKFPVLGSDGEPLVTDSTSTLRVRVAGIQARGELAFRLRDLEEP